MADHPSILALAKSQYERNPEYDDDDCLIPFDALEPEHRDSLIKGAALDYAAVLGDLMEPSEAMKDAWSSGGWSASQKHRALLRARADELTLILHDPPSRP